MAVTRTTRRQLRTLLLAVPLVFLAWTAGMLLIALLQAPGVPVAVMSLGGANAALRTIAAADGYILQVRGNVVIAISDDAAFVARLYRAGALAVAAASTGGCIVAQPGNAVAREPAPSPAGEAPLNSV
jgi:hypothetical protein